VRITDRFKYDLFLYQFNTVKRSLDSVQEQIASQKKVNRPSDDPVAFSTYVSLNSESLLYEQLTGIFSVSLHLDGFTKRALIL